MISPFRILAVISLIALPVFWSVAASAQGEGKQGSVGAAPLLPVPRPEPGAVPGLASKRIQVDDFLTLPMAYAPPLTGFEAIQAGESELTLEARLADGSPPLAHGVTWRIFASQPGTDGTLPLVATSNGGGASFQLPGGTYYVHAAYGRAGAVKRVDMHGQPRDVFLNLDTGGLRLTAVIGEDKPADAQTVTFEIYKDVEDGERIRLVDDADENTVLRLNAGTYHVVSRYGTVNAIVRADIQVSSGKLTEATIHHKGAEVTLKLVEDEGGEALANTQWTVLTPAGDILHNSVGAFPSIILAEGTYTAFARHGDQNYNRDFEVEAGIDRDVEVRLSDLDIQSTGIRLSR
jgi:hypothetical protein